MIMISLTYPKCGVANVKNPNVKKTIVNVLGEIKNVIQVVDARIVLIRKKYQINLRKRRNLKLLPIEILTYITEN